MQVSNELQWKRFCDLLGADELVDDPRFATNQVRVKNRDELRPLIQGYLEKRTAQEWEKVCLEAGVPVSHVRKTSDVIKDEQAWQNNYFMKAYCEEVKRDVEVRGLPVTLSKTPGEITSLGPQLGQDTEILMMDLLQYEWDEIEAFKAKGAIP